MHAETVHFNKATSSLRLVSPQTIEGVTKVRDMKAASN